MLLAGDGLTAEGIAAAVGKSLLTVRRWRRRYVAKGVDGLLKDASRPSRVKPLTPEKVKQVVDMTLHAKPPNATQWSVRSMAVVAGVSYSSVQRIWRAHGLKPHLVETFKVSRDKNFAAKVEEVVGLYLNPPDKALVLCVDEKSQIQALDRTQPGLPMKKGRAGTMTHDYKRNGTTTLFAALNMLDGKVIGACMPRHRHREFLRFLKLIDHQTPAGLDLHLIVDNYATHKTPAVKRWIKAHPRFHLHFTPGEWTSMLCFFGHGILLSLHGLAGEVAEVVAFLVSDSARNVNGAEIAVDRRAHCRGGSALRRRAGPDIATAGPSFVSGCRVPQSAMRRSPCAR